MYRDGTLNLTMELEAWRRSVGLHATELAEILGVHARTVRRYETGERYTFTPEFVADIYLLSEGRVRPDHLYLPAMRRMILRGYYAPL